MTPAWPHLAALVTLWSVQWSVKAERQAPVIDGGSFTKLVTLDQLVMISCDATGVPAPRRFWKKDGKPLRSFGKRYSINKQFFTLRIWKMTEDDVGIFTCRAKNKYGKDEINVKVVLGSPPSATIQPNMKINHTTDLQVTCQSSGFPTPSFTWTRGNTILRGDERTTIVADDTSDNTRRSILRITGATHEERGTYTCRALNELGSDSADTFVDVNYPPFVLSKPRDTIYWWEGHQATLTCEVTANKPATVVWYRMEETGEPTVLMGVETRSDDDRRLASVLQLNLPTDSPTSDSGTYVCTAENELAKVTAHTFHVQKANTPSVLELTVLTIVPYELGVSVSVSESAPALQYVVAAYRKVGAVEDEYNKTCDIDKSGQCHVSLSGVLQFNHYILRARARNQAGWGKEVVKTIYIGSSEDGWTIEDTDTTVTTTSTNKELVDTTVVTDTTASVTVTDSSETSVAYVTTDSNAIDTAQSTTGTTGTTDTMEPVTDTDGISDTTGTSETPETTDTDDTSDAPDTTHHVPDNSDTTDASDNIRAGATSRLNVTNTSMTQSGVTNTPVTTSGVTNTPVTTRGVTNTPVTQSGVTNTTVTTSDVTDTPVTTSGVSNTPVTQSGDTNTPVTTSGVTNTPVTTSGVTNTPVTTSGVTNTTVTKSDDTNTPVTTPGVTNTKVAPFSDVTIPPVTSHSVDTVTEVTSDEEVIENSSVTFELLSSDGDSSAMSLHMNVLTIAALYSVYILLLL